MNKVFADLLSLTTKKIPELASGYEVLRMATHKPMGVEVDPPGQAIDVRVLRLMASLEKTNAAEPLTGKLPEPPKIVPVATVIKHEGWYMLTSEELALYDTVAAL
jgi:hypothetical protein